jgi:hypothetical protein
MDSASKKNKYQEYFLERKRRLVPRAGKHIIIYFKTQYFTFVHGFKNLPEDGQKINRNK